MAYAAALWALVSAMIHIAWAAGLYPVLAAHPSQLVFATPRRWGFNVIAAALCSIAVPAALATVASWGQRLPRRLVYGVAWTCSALLLLRSAASLIKISYFVAAGQFKFAALGFWEPWFWFGAILFTMSTRRFSKERR